MNIKLANKRGFTLMELLIVIAILGILGVAFVPNILKAPAKARDAVRVKKVQDVHTAIEAYYAEKGTLPAESVAAPGCMASDVATVIGLKEAPIDSNRKGSCTAEVAGANDNLYVYKTFNNGKNYIVGALMEVKEAANTTMPSNGLMANPPKVSNDPAGTFFVAAGPI